jgi:hypothetical protein
MPLTRLDDVTFGDAEVDAAFRRWREAIERALTWEVEGATLDAGPTGFALHVRRPEGIVRAVVTTAIPAAPSASTVSNAGRARLLLRTGTTLGNGDIVTVYNDFAVAIPVGTRILVAPDGGGYMLVSSNCPP